MCHTMSLMHCATPSVTYRNVPHDVNAMCHTMCHLPQCATRSVTYRNVPHQESPNAMCHTKCHLPQCATPSVTNRNVPHQVSPTAMCQTKCHLPHCATLLTSSHLCSVAPCTTALRPSLSFHFTTKLRKTRPSVNNCSSRSAETSITTSRTEHFSPTNIQLLVVLRSIVPVRTANVSYNGSSGV